MKRLVVFSVFLMLLAITARAEQRSLKVFISVDMEGVGGVSTWDIQAGSEGRDYGTFRRLMTLEVNAAIAGAFEAGATEVLVGDSHGDAQNLDLELLDKRVRVIRAWPRPLLMMQGLDETFDAVVFVGYHAGEGQADAVLAHTMSGLDVFEIKLNGIVVQEAGFNAAIAGEFGVPVVFLSGDQTICDDARNLLGALETAAVKEATGYYSAKMMHPEEAQRLIREGVRRGVERRDELSPFKMDHPVEMEITFKNTVNAELAAQLPGVERPSGNTIAFTAEDALGASGFLGTVLTLDPW